MRIIKEEHIFFTPEENNCIEKVLELFSNIEECSQDGSISGDARTIQFAIQNFLGNYTVD